MTIRFIPIMMGPKVPETEFEKSRCALILGSSRIGNGAFVRGCACLEVLSALNPGNDGDTSIASMLRWKAPVVRLGSYLTKSASRPFSAHPGP